MNIGPIIGSSPANQAAAQNAAVDRQSASGKMARAPQVSGTVECETCKNRRYVDGSNDATVSFKTPTSVSPGASYAAVSAHEREHVVHEQANARQSGREIVSQNVSIHYAICPECGRSYVSGGTTTTVTKAAAENRTARRIPLQRTYHPGQFFDAKM